MKICRRSVGTPLRTADEEGGELKYEGKPLTVESSRKPKKGVGRWLRVNG